MDTVERARSLLEATAKVPAMYATCREAMIARVCGIASVVIDDFNTSEFYMRHIGVNTSVLSRVDDEWAKMVVADALSRFPKELT